MKSLLQDIQTKEFKNVYLLFGEEGYLKLQYRQRLQEALIPPDDTMNLNCYEGNGISVEALIDQAETLPFFAERRLLLVENSGLFKSGGEKLAGYLEQLPPTTYMVFVESEVDKRQRLYKTVRNVGRAVEFSRQTEETISRWVVGILKREGKNITRQTMNLFLEKTGNDMNNIRSELEKLLCYTMGREVITSEDVEKICTAQTVNRIFDMVNAVAAGDQKKALDLYYDLLALKEPPMRILFLLTRQFNQLLQARELSAHGYDSEHIAERMGVQKFVARSCVRQAEGFTPPQLRRLVEEGVGIEEAVKTGNLPEKMGVELLLQTGVRAARSRGN